jgi:thymidylate synthase (FAD)
VREGHESIIEHVSFTFLIEGISRSCSHQLVRHRLASYSQESQRYCEPVADGGMVLPPAVDGDPEAKAIWQQAVDGLVQAYRALRERGVRKEDARFLLPNAMATRIVVSMNARTLRHFFAVRLAPAAQWEIRSVAMEMLRLVYPLAPSLFVDLHETYVVDRV